MDKINPLITRWRIACNSLCRFRNNWFRSSNGGWLSLADGPKMSQRCRIQVRSDESAGQFMLVIGCCWRKSITTKTLWDRVLSSWSTAPYLECCEYKGLNNIVSISNAWQVLFDTMERRSVIHCKAIPYHDRSTSIAIMLPNWGILNALSGPSPHTKSASLKEIVNLDSLMESTMDHC